MVQVFHSGPHPLPSPPVVDKQPKSPDDKRAVPGAKSAEEKLVALHAYRHAHGLCERCTERWSRDHKCSSTVQLQAMQELWELFNVEDSDVQSCADGASEDQLCLAISLDAVSGVSGPHTLQQA
ncbi:hypothetical protein C2845_PM03G27810 [Panicum miliaceum]|uniref:Uncharacterized protein n=1 Tax=Panicum miliaceum TaxID=4540 RepID=A0A3L6T784_PANMI|nr:hypothetical protein C2845_PM03G27810 [Panicum miliaceum]